jgi:hypothetical protein
VNVLLDHTTPPTFELLELKVRPLPLQEEPLAKRARGSVVVPRTPVADSHGRVLVMWMTRANVVLTV